VLAVIDALQGAKMGQRNAELSFATTVALRRDQQMRISTLGLLSRRLTPELSCKRIR
jgi:hypothetical protein